MRNPPSRAPRQTDQGGRSSLVWSFAGALLASLCCVGPLIAVLLGIGGATSLLGLVRFKVEFIAIGLIMTLIGIGVSLRRSKACCSVKTYRRNRILIPAVSLTVFAVLVIGANAALLDERVIDAASVRLSDQNEQIQWVAVEPTVSLIAHESTTPVAPASSSLEATLVPTQAEVEVAAVPVARQLDVAITDGVWCGGCLLAIEDEVMQIAGVQGSTFVKEASSPGYFVIRLTYDPAQVEATTLLATVRNAPGSIDGQYGAEIIADEPAAT